MEQDAEGGSKKVVHFKKLHHASYGNSSCLYTNLSYAAWVPIQTQMKPFSSCTASAR